MPELRAERRKSKPRVMKSAWKKLRQPLARSNAVKHALAGAIAGAVKFVIWTNPAVAGSDDPESAAEAYSPAIAALWHGQHLLGPAVNPRDRRLVAMFSRSADAELNAMMLEKFGVEAVRGRRALQHPYVRGQQRVDPLARQRLPGVRRHLPTRVDTGIGPSGDRQRHRPPGLPLQRPLQDLLHRPLPRLGRPARELPAVVLDGEAGGQPLLRATMTRYSASTENGPSPPAQPRAISTKSARIWA